MSKKTLNIDLRHLIVVFIFCLYSTCLAGANRNLIIRGDADFPPMSFINDKGSPDGFDVDLMKEIMARLDVPCDFKLSDWDTILHDYDAGKVDVISGITFNNDLHAIGKLSDYTAVLNRYVIYRKGTKINRLCDLRGKKVKVLTTSSSYDFLKQRAPGAKLSESESFTKEITELSKGKYDAVVCNRGLAMYLVEKKKLDNLMMKDFQIPSTPYLIMASSDTVMYKINKILFDLKIDGTYDKIFAKWFNSVPQSQTSPLLYGIAGTIALIALVLYVFVVILRKKVKKSSYLLKLENENLSVAIRAGNIDVLAYDIKKNKLRSVKGDALIKGEISLQEAYEMIHPDDIEEFTSYFETLFRGYKKDLGVIVVRTRSVNIDEWQYGKFVFASLNEDDKEHPTIIIAYKNINNEFLEKKRLKEMTQNLNLSMEAGGLSPWIYDVDKEIFCTILINNSKQRNISREYLIRLIHEEDKEMAINYLNDISIGKIDKVNVIFRICIFSHIHFYECVMVKKITDECEIKQINIAIKDITDIVKEQIELKEFRLKTELAIKSSNIMQWDYDVNEGTITVNNQQGIPNGTKLPKDTFYSIDGMEGFIKEMDNGYDKPFSFETVSKKNNGEVEKFLTISGSPLSANSKGRVVKYTGFSKDNTEMKLIQLRLKKEKERAELADRSKTAFLANMSHDIRTPLNSIIGFSELLQDESDKDTRSEYMQIINTNSDLLLRLINDILDLAKIEAGLIEYIDSEFDFAPFFNDLAKSLKLKISKESVEYIIDSPYKSCVLTFDKNRIAQIITNYLSNAVKYTPSGSIKLGYGYKDNGIYIYVKDTGIGIPEDKQYRVFQRFEKLDTFAQGTGLGLSICKAIVESRNGKVGFKSVLNEGSLFWAWIPCDAKIDI